MRPKDADRMANSVDPGQTDPDQKSDLGISRLPSTVCLKT